MSDNQNIPTNQEAQNLVTLTADIVSAYVSNNTIVPNQIPAVIDEVFGALHKAFLTPAGGHDKLPEPAVPIQKSVTPDYIICLEDGKKFKSLKRHLRSHYDLSPEEYRQRWSLPYDYPMVAPNYAATRSALAKKMGLGRKQTEVNQPQH